MMISIGCSGETSNCSNVPSSRSRATDMPTIITTVIIVSVPSRLGAIDRAEIAVGLYQVRLTISLAGGGRVARRA